MSKAKIDIYSPEYRELLSIDSRSHGNRTDKLTDVDVPWIYDPLNCKMPIAWAYDHVVGSEFRRWNRIIAKKFGGPIRMVDLGCGPGGSSLWFAAHGHDVIGVDACAERIDIAREIASRYEGRIRQAGGRLRFECADFFSFAPEKCQAVISVKTLHHVPDIEALIVKYARHLSANGCFLILDQVGCTNFSHHAQKIARAFYPPGLCKTPWHLRQSSAAGSSCGWPVFSKRKRERRQRSPWTRWRESGKIRSSQVSRDYFDESPFAILTPFAFSTSLWISRTGHAANSC